MAAPSSIAPPAEVALAVTRALLFKNGLAYVVSEAELPPGLDWVTVRPLPEPVHGTLWVWVDGVPVEAIAASEERSEEVEARTVGELLAANAGREVVLLIGGEQHKGK